MCNVQPFKTRLTGQTAAEKPPENEKKRKRRTGVVTEREESI